MCNILSTSFYHLSSHLCLTFSNTWKFVHLLYSGLFCTLQHFEFEWKCAIRIEHFTLTVSNNYSCDSVEVKHLKCSVISTSLDLWINKLFSGKLKNIVVATTQHNTSNISVSEIVNVFANRKQKKNIIRNIIININKTIHSIYVCCCCCLYIILYYINIDD